MKKLLLILLLASCAKEEPIRRIDIETSGRTLINQSSSSNLSTHYLKVGESINIQIFGLWTGDKVSLKIKKDYNLIKELTQYGGINYTYMVD